MILGIHIALAIISIIYASYVVISPSKIKLRITYLLTLGTIASGLAMILVNPAHLGQTCVKGAVYIGFMIAASIVAQKRLALLKL